jgi:hypothetical protein
MKLLYYDDRTPTDYQPPLFKESLEDINFTLDAKPLKVDFGTAATAFHRYFNFPLFSQVMLIFLVIASM